MKKTSLLMLTALTLWGVQVGWAADSPQFRGPNRDGKYLDTGLMKQWPAGGPQLVWSVKGLGGGWSSASVANGTVYVTGMDSHRQGWLYAFTTAGKLKWKATYGAESKGGGHAGARTTPTVDGDRVYVMSSTGHLVCFAAANGDKVFDVDTLARFKGVPPRWAIAESPLIDGNHVICTPGGPDATIVALNKMNGDTVWTSKGLGVPSTFCSPDLIKIGNRRLIVTQVKGLVVGVDADTGQTLWRQKLVQRMGIKPVSPVYANGMVYATAAGAGGVMLQLSPDGSTATEKWTDKTLDCLHHGVVIVNGHIYGTAQSGKRLVCLDLATGKVCWTAKQTGMASVVYADGMLYAYGEDGVMRLIKADPNSYQEVSSFKITEGTGEHWAHPTIANGRLYVRHGDAMMVYDIKAPTP